MTKITKLRNGLTIVTEPNKNVETVFVSVGIKVGNRNELDSEIGLSHYLEHLLFKGTTKRTCKELNEAVDSVGAYTNAYTSNEQTVYYIKGLKNHLELAIDVLSDQVLNSIFPQEEMDKESHVVVQEIKRSQDNQNDMLYEGLSSACYPNDRLSTPILGFENQILAYKSEDLKKYYRKHYHTKNMILSVSGNVKHKDVVELAKKYFHTKDKFKHKVLSSPEFKSGEVLIHKEEDNQVSVAIAFPLKGHNQLTFKERKILQLFDTIMSSGMTSKLFSEIREKRGLVYSVSSFVEFFTNTGLFGITGGTDNTKVEEFLEATALVLNTFKDNLTEQDLQKSKNVIKTSTATHLESINSQGLSNLTSLQNYGKIFDINETLRIIDEITLDDIKKVVTDILKNKPSISIYGNAPQIQEKTIGLNKFLEHLYGN